MGPLHDYRFPGDEAIYHALNGLDWPWLFSLSRLFSNRTFEIGLALLVVVYVFIRHRRLGLATLVLTVLSITVNDRLGAAVLKPGFARQRPCYALAPDKVHQGEPVAHSGSLPSSHASNAFAAALPLSLGAPELGPLIYAIATLVALSRVQLGVHWPSDVGVGAVVGTLVAGALLTLWRAARKRLGDPGPKSESGVE